METLHHDILFLSSVFFIEIFMADMNQELYAKCFILGVNALTGTSRVREFELGVREIVEIVIVIIKKQGKKHFI